MLNDRHKNILRITCLILVLCMVIPPVINTWYWRQDHFTLFDLSQELQKNGTNFYEWLGIEVTDCHCCRSYLVQRQTHTNICY